MNTENKYFYSVVEESEGNFYVIKSYWKKPVEPKRSLFGNIYNELLGSCLTIYDRVDEVLPKRHKSRKVAMTYIRKKLDYPKTYLYDRDQ